jgi:hypothetical protein
VRAALYIGGPLAFLVAAIAVFGLLLPACAALSWTGWLPEDSCPRAGPAPAQAALMREEERRDSLLAEFRRLERDLYTTDCPTDPAPDIEPDRALLDEERWRAQDIGLMAGCWQLESDYALTYIQSQEQVTVPLWRVCFDEQGRGRQEFDLSNGVTCEGPMAAAFESAEVMTLSDGGTIPCSDGSRILERRAECRLDATRRAACEIADERGTAHVELRREE